MQLSGVPRDVSFRFNFSAEDSAEPSSAAAVQGTAAPPAAEAREVWPERAQVRIKHQPDGDLLPAAKGKDVQPGNLSYDTVSLGPDRQLLKVGSDDPVLLVLKAWV